MNACERIKKAINHEEGDRIPIDLGGRQSGIHIKAYKSLLEYLKIEDPNIRYSDFTQQLAQPCEEILERFHVDTRYIYPEADLIDLDFIPEKVMDYKGVYDQFGVFWGNDAAKKTQEILYYSPVIHPFDKFKNITEIEEYEWPKASRNLKKHGLHEKARKLKEKTNFILVSPPIGNTFEYTTFLFGLKQAMKLVRRAPEMIIHTMKKLLEYWTDFMELYSVNN